MFTCFLKQKNIYCCSYSNNLRSSNVQILNSLDKGKSWSMTNNKNQSTFQRYYINNWNMNDNQSAFPIKIIRRIRSYSECKLGYAQIIQTFGAFETIYNKYH